MARLSSPTFMPRFPEAKAVCEKKAVAQKLDSWMIHARMYEIALIEEDHVRTIAAESDALPAGGGRYEAVCRWLEAQGGAVERHPPSMYPQGSIRIGTTVRTFGRDEHDLDFVCECGVPQQHV